MGAGDYAAGFADIAGEDPIAVLSAARDLLPPRALAFDGETRTFLRDENGLLLSVHPIDQKVALALFIEQKKIAVAGLGTETIACACGRAWSEPKWAQAHYTQDKCGPAPTAPAKVKEAVK